MRVLRHSGRTFDRAAGHGYGGATETRTLHFPDLLVLYIHEYTVAMVPASAAVSSRLDAGAEDLFSKFEAANKGQMHGSPHRMRKRVVC